MSKTTLEEVQKKLNYVDNLCTTVMDRARTLNRLANDNTMIKVQSMKDSMMGCQGYLQWLENEKLEIEEKIKNTKQEYNGNKLALFHVIHEMILILSEIKDIEDPYNDQESELLYGGGPVHPDTTCL